MVTKQEEVPAWVEGFFLPEFERMLRRILREEFGLVEAALNAQCNSLEKKLDSN